MSQRSHHCSENTLKVFRWWPLGGSDGCARVPAALEEAGGVPHALGGFLSVSGIKSRTFPTSWTDPHTARRALQILHWKEARLVSLALSSTSPVGAVETKFSPAVRCCWFGTSSTISADTTGTENRETGPEWVLQMRSGLFRDICVIMKVKVESRSEPAQNSISVMGRHRAS